MEQKLIYKNEDCIEFLKSLDDRTVDLICTDPPYYRVVNDEWDNQWFTIDEYYSWCEHCLLYTSPSPRDQRGSRMPSSA